jgi:hypothetical protein
MSSKKFNLKEKHKFKKKIHLVLCFLTYLPTYVNK